MVLWTTGGYDLNNAFIADRPAIHFEIEINYGGTAKAPGQPAFGGSPVNDFIRKKRIEVVHRVDLRCGRISPVCPERAKAALHLTKHEASLLPKTFWAHITAPHTALLVAALPFWSFAAPGDYEAWLTIRVRCNRIRECVQRRRLWRINRGANIAASHRIYSTVEDPPFR